MDSAFKDFSIAVTPPYMLVKVLAFTGGFDPRSVNMRGNVIIIVGSAVFEIRAGCFVAAIVCEA